MIGSGINMLMRGESWFRSSKRVLFNACYVKSGLEVKEGWPSTDVYQRDEQGLLFSNSLPLWGSITNYQQLKDREGGWQSRILNPSLTWYLHLLVRRLWRALRNGRVQEHGLFLAGQGYVAPLIPLDWQLPPITGRASSFLVFLEFSKTK